ncbi:hypothetical protein CRM22_010142 [Opisthorchis felineus]|uniref:Uncharacterized protein n=1 Tax=Opisthorchis felineus TaxID=147828 RepID=A0A4S2L829_OPIFE|nr:hypothetical protein CRM22_010142 [Opisthorchis felineus]
MADANHQSFTTRSSKTYYCTDIRNTVGSEHEFSKSLVVGLQNSLWWTDFNSFMKTSPWLCPKTVLVSDDEDQDTQNPALLLENNEFTDTSTVVAVRKRPLNWDELEACRVSKIRRKKKNPVRQWTTAQLMGDYWTENEAHFDWSASEDETDVCIKHSCISCPKISKRNNTSLRAILQTSHSVITKECVPEGIQAFNRTAGGDSSQMNGINELGSAANSCQIDVNPLKEINCMKTLPEYLNCELRCLREFVVGSSFNYFIFHLANYALGCLNELIHPPAKVTPGTLNLTGEYRSKLIYMPGQLWSPTETSNMIQGWSDETVKSVIIMLLLSQMSTVTSKLRWIFEEIIRPVTSGSNMDLVKHPSKQFMSSDVCEMRTEKVFNRSMEEQVLEMAIPHVSGSIPFVTCKMPRLKEQKFISFIPDPQLSEDLRKINVILSPRAGGPYADITIDLRKLLPSEWKISTCASETTFLGWQPASCMTAFPWKEESLSVSTLEIRRARAMYFNNNIQPRTYYATQERLTMNPARNVKHSITDSWKTAILLTAVNMSSFFMDSVQLMTKMDDPNPESSKGIESLNLQIPFSMYQYLDQKKQLNSIVSSILNKTGLYNNFFSNKLNRNFLKTDSETSPPAKAQFFMEIEAAGLWSFGVKRNTVLGLKNDQKKKATERDTLKPIEQKGNQYFGSDSPVSAKTDRDDPDLTTWTFLNEDAFCELEGNVLDDWVLVDEEL